MAKTSKQKKYLNFKGGDGKGREIIEKSANDIIGQTIEVYWDGEDSWYKGRVQKIDDTHTEQDEETKKVVPKPFYIVYQDGDDEWVDLKNDIWRLAEAGADNKKRKGSQVGGANKKAREDEEGTAQMSYDTQDFPRRTISRTEGVQVDEVFSDPFIYEVLIEIGGDEFSDVKVRCGETCVVVDYKQPQSEKKEEQGDNNENTGQDAKASELQRQILVILPNKLDNNSANAFMSPNGRMKVQVKCRLGNDTKSPNKKE